MLLLSLLFAATIYVPAPTPCPSDLVVGSYYFPGHFSPVRWMPFKAAGFPLPLLGYYRDGEPEVMDWHIKWAVEHGIDFFAFDWYYDCRHGPARQHNLALDRGFLRARFRKFMNFCLMWCNEGRNERYSRHDMLRLARLLAERYFSQPNYLRIDGDNLLIISVPKHLLASFGTAGTAAVFREMDRLCRTAGCGGLFPVAKQDTDQPSLKAAGFRAITAYNYPTAGMTAAELKARRAPYSSMVRGYEEIWRRVTSQGVLPYIVTVSPGWDSRPWHGDNALVRTNPRPRLFYEMCRAARRYVDPHLRMVIAECWNEFGEGSYIEPTVQYGFAYLDAMRDAFCPDNPHHIDLTPQSLGMTVPTFPEIPDPPDKLMAEGKNMLYNGDMEQDWGWLYYEGLAARFSRSGHSGRCLLVPAGRGVKTNWLMPLPRSRKLVVTFWFRASRRGRLKVKAALFAAGRWLKRYATVAEMPSAGAAGWRQARIEFTVEDPQAEQFNIEFIADGADFAVDDVDVRAAAAP